MKVQPIIIALLVILAIDFIIAQFNSNPKVVVKDKLPFNYNAQTIPPFGIRVQTEDQDNEMLLKHELVHWKQYQATGAIIFHIRYALQSLLFGYDKMPMEIEARQLSGEKAECLTDYTNCVRNGTASTITDLNFRA